MPHDHPGRTALLEDCKPILRWVQHLWDAIIDARIDWETVIYGASDHALTERIMGCKVPAGVSALLRDLYNRRIEADNPVTPE